MVKGSSLRGWDARPAKGPQERAFLHAIERQEGESRPLNGWYRVNGPWPTANRKSRAPQHLREPEDFTLW
ncbi:hypothetical protein GCM10010320_09820 [Streptomyces caelestis]|nr:hypothetical protein GCM10010320_09820 [Streptomyces caelestis]